ncbi:MAG TPA: AGE family epimerase/isomerase [Flavisolibacter sp.]|nr:AGE family epimerase/isomerase [Flavisolibacter sp.]
MRRFLVAMSLLLFWSSAMAQKIVTASERKERSQIADEMAKSVTTELLDKYYPQNVDSVDGGFITTYTFDFKPVGPQDKFIVTQARHTWTTAKASEDYPQKAFYLKISEHGFRFLRDVMWDKKHGGFYNLVDRQGRNKSNLRSPKEAYGNAFGIYALAAYYKASKDTGALSLAKKAFRWLENHSHDAVHKGYYQHLKEDGTPILRDKTVSTNAATGYKDQNSSIHLLEALTELYGVWPDPLVRARLEEMLYLIRDKMVTKKGYLALYFTADLMPISFRDSSEAFIRQNKNLDHVSFGHDVETAFLMLEASHALGIKNDEATITVGKRMVDHALQNGWDSTLGGFYNEGYYFKNKQGITILFDSKNWWAQAEGLNTLLLMADRFPNDPMRYFEKFKQLWRYVQTYLIDHVNGDWYEEGLDKEPQRRTALKAHIWKATYHNYRALANCIKRLRKAEHE